MNNSDILPREQSHGDPMMHEPKSGVLDVHVTRLKFSNYDLTWNFIPKFMAIKTSNSMVYVNSAFSMETYALGKISPSAKILYFKQKESDPIVNFF